MSRNVSGLKIPIRGVMKLKSLLCIIGAILTLAGCASNQGGTYDEYQTGTGASVNPGPVASPSMRPGMNPDDPRDPHFTNRPIPESTPSNNQP
jgi:hypothetical protein